MTNILSILLLSNNLIQVNFNLEGRYFLYTTTNLTKWTYSCAWDTKDYGNSFVINNNGAWNRYFIALPVIK